ncbi:hypothetical protein Ahy_A04g019485 [Arachis hypogaea]|uniref:Uncharacterized protein n=1 Tax=Arachis hypogaea TaxID=3818 RepID=A0A445DG24_ARAHY|nr:hypothetical protein Ahy_A04g019485 [Arachis hypogaea]
MEPAQWVENAESIVPFLRVFSDATVRISDTLYVISDMFMTKSCDPVYFSTMSMAERIRVKYEKY